MSKLKGFMKSKDCYLWMMMIVGTIIYCFGIVFLLDLGEFYAGGITGIAQLITAIMKKIYEVEITGFKRMFILLLSNQLFEGYL